MNGKSPTGDFMKLPDQIAKDPELIAYGSRWLNNMDK